MHKIIKVLKSIGTADCYVKRSNHAQNKKIEIGMCVYAENNIAGVLIALKRAPRGGNCVGVVLSDKPNSAGMHEIAVRPGAVGIHCPF